MRHLVRTATGSDDPDVLEGLERTYQSDYETHAQAGPTDRYVHVDKPLPGIQGIDPRGVQLILRHGRKGRIRYDKHESDVLPSLGNDGKINRVDTASKEIDTVKTHAFSEDIQGSVLIIIQGKEV